MRFILSACALASVFAAPAFATGRENTAIEVSSVAVSSAGAELELGFLDRSPVQQACDYYVSRFEYVATEPALLLVELRSPEPCLVDRYGRRAGSLRWTIPSMIRGSGRLNVIVNERDAGEVQLSGTNVNFIRH